MGLQKPTVISVILIVFTIFFRFPTSKSESDLYNLVYKGCSNQTFLDSATYHQTIVSLLNSLATESSSSRFNRASGGSGQSSFTGLFQCRGDLSNEACNKCVMKLTGSSDLLCGNSVAARLQFLGCYLHYEIAGFTQISGTQFLYKRCTSSESKGDFEEKRDTALANLQSGITSASNGFYATSYGSVYAMAQCEGDLSSGDCSNCVQMAIQKAEVECGGSSGGQVFLNRCYISYSYHGSGFTVHSSSSGQPTGKTVAIVIGGVAAVAFAGILVLFIRSSMKKRDDY